MNIFIERLEDVYRQAAIDNLSTWVVSAIQWQPFKVHKHHHSVKNTFVLVLGLIDEKNQVYQSAIDIIDKTIVKLEREM